MMGVDRKFDVTEKLVIDGGEPGVRTPVPPRKRHGELEKRYLNEVIDSETLFFYLGTKVRALERRFAALYAKKRCVGCASGTAARERCSVNSARRLNR
jgi:hypothetical protein